MIILCIFLQLIGADINEVKKEREAIRAQIKELEEQLKAIDGEISFLREQLASMNDKKDKAFGTINELKRAREDAVSENFLYLFYIVIELYMLICVMMLFPSFDCYITVINQGYIEENNQLRKCS